MTRSQDLELAATIEGYLNEPENQKPKTLYGVDILVRDWEKATFNEHIDPNVLPVPFPLNFTDEETGCPLANDDYPTDERTPTGSSGSSSSDEPLIVPIKNKNKQKEDTSIHDDPMCDDIYEPVKQEEKPYVPTHELQELIKIQDYGYYQFSFQEKGGTQDRYLLPTGKCPRWICDARGRFTTKELQHAERRNKTQDRNWRRLNHNTETSQGNQEGAPATEDEGFVWFNGTKTYHTYRGC